MKMKFFLISLVLSSSLMLSANATTSVSQAVAPSAKVQALINKYKLKIVDFKYTKNVIGKGTKKSAKAILIDARPNAKYLKSAIPSSINIPDTEFEQYYQQLSGVNKNKEIIVYCGGWKCAKSPKVAAMLMKKGFTNIKLYQAGEPEWIKRSYKEVSTHVVKVAQEKNSALIVDARPYKKFMEETIAGSIGIPDTKLNELIGRFPINKNEKIIVFCGGYACGKSHKLANKLVDLSYKNVAVYAGGLPQWKKEGLSTTKSAVKTIIKKDEEKSKFSKNGLKLGADEGTVDGEWFLKLIREGKIPSYVQIVDVTAPDEFIVGHLKGAINIEAEKLSAKELYLKLPKDKTIVFNCTAGGRSTEAWAKLKDEKYDVSEIYYFDANIDCKGNDCKIELNEPIE